jgi:PAS domain S-box-containing protein
MESNQRESSTAQIGDRWVEISADPIFDDDNKLIGAVHLIKDITQNKLTELKLRESEEKFHGLFDSFPHFIGLVDLEGVLIECNVAINKFLSRHTKDDLIGLNFIKILSIIDKNKDLVPKFEELMQQAISDGKLKSFEFRIYRSSGDIMWLQIEGSLISIGRQKFIQFIIQDITARKIVEEKLKKSELKIQERVNQLGCIYKLSKLIDNPNISPENLIYGTLELIPPALQFAELARIRILYKNNEYKSIDFKKSEWKLTTTETINGEEIIIEVFYLENKPFLKEEYDLVREIINRLKSCFEEREAQKKLNESEEKYRLISENAYDMVSILNEQMKYEFVNEQAFLKTMGRTKKDLLGKRPLKWAHPDDIEKCINTFKEGFKRGEANIQGRFKDTNGKYLWLDVKGKTFIDLDGEKKALIIARDITDQKLVNDKLKESEEKFRTITEHSHLGIMIIQKGQFKYANQAMSIINGYTIEEMLKWSPKDMVNLVHPEDLPNVIEQFNRNIVSTGDQFVNNIYRLITKNGTIKWVESYGKEFIYEGDYASLISVIDRTEIIETELKLKESEERYRLIYENANDLIRVLNDKFEFEYLNEKVHKRILGYSKEDLIGQTHLPFLHPEDRRQAIRSTVRNLKKGEGSYQARFKDKKGIYRWFEFSATIFFDRKGEKKILSIARDISERKRAEEELKNSEERYRLISQNAEENLFIFDMNMNLIYNDTRVPNILGYSYEEMKTLKLTDYNTSSSLKVALGAYREEIRNERKNLKDPKRIRTFEIEQIHKDGSIVNVETRFTFLRDEKGKATGILGLSRNISKRKQAERKLSESEEKYRLISETAYDLIGMLNKKFKYEYINENAFKQILGYSSSEILGKSALKFIHPDDASKIAKSLFEGFKQGQGGGVLRFKHKEGHWVWLEAKGKTCFDRDG